MLISQSRPPSTRTMLPTLAIWKNFSPGRGPGSDRRRVCRSGGHLPHRISGPLKMLGFQLSLAMTKDPTQDLLLAPRDRVVVYDRPTAQYDSQRVRVQGEVSRPGEYPHFVGIARARPSLAGWRRHSNRVDPRRGLPTRSEGRDHPHPGRHSVHAGVGAIAPRTSS